jgi:hypothetical protein
MIFRRGKWSTPTFAIGGWTEPGNVFTRRCAERCDTPLAVILTLARRSWIVKASRRRKKGPRGYDAWKKINGRKRHLLVDTLGLVLEVRVHPADVQDRDGAKMVLEPLRTKHGRLKKIWADEAYRGALLEWVRQLRHGRGRRRLELEIVAKRADGTVVI